MRPKTIPFAPLPLSALEKIAAPFFGIGARVERAFPYLKIELKQAEFDIDAREYAAIMVFLAGFYFIIFALLITAILTRFIGNTAFLLGPTVAAVFAFMVFIQLSMYPKMLIRKKVRNLEMNLVFALRTMLVQIKSGVSLFDSMNMLANGNYGALSKEFRKAVDEINTGRIQEVALQDLATNNPSTYFRKALWQIVNGMKAGADISDVIAESVNTMNIEQKIAIRRYGNQLRVMSLMYMMIGVIVPALGLTFLIVLGSFPKIQITEPIFWLLLGGVVLMEFMYIGMIKSTRPNIMSA